MQSTVCDVPISKQTIVEEMDVMVKVVVNLINQRNE